MTISAVELTRKSPPREIPTDDARVARKMASRRPLLVALITTLIHEGACLSTRRAVLSHAAAAAAVTTLPPLAAHAAQRGAEPAYQNQAFGDEVCVRRTPLGACAETAKGGRAAGDAPLKVLQIEAEPESELVKRLLQKTEENKDSNARLVLEKTIKAGQSGQYGPFASEAPIMRQDGTFDVVSIRRFEKLKDRGKLTKSATGLDQYVKGFDPDAPEAKEKFLGLF